MTRNRQPSYIIGRFIVGPLLLICVLALLIWGIVAAVVGIVELVTPAPIPSGYQLPTI